MDRLSLSEANLLKEIQYYSGDFSLRPVEVSASYFPLNCDKQNRSNIDTKTHSYNPTISHVTTSLKITEEF